MWNRISASLAMLALCGCGEIPIEDDFTRDGLSPAYVPGAETIVRSRSGAALNADDWRFVSSDLSVFSIANRSNFCLFTCSGKSAGFQAVGLGTAELSLVDASNRELATATIEVVVPTAAALAAGEDIVVGGAASDDDEVAALEDAERVEGRVRLALPDGGSGPTVFALDLSREGRRVVGIGDLFARSDSGAVNAFVEASTRLVGRPWLTLEPLEVGRATVSVEVAEQRFAVFDVEVVSPDVVRTLEIVGRSGRSVGVIARDGEGRRVFGVAPAWTVDGLRVGDGHRVPLVEEPGQRVLRVCHGDDVCDELVLPNLTPTLAFDGNALPPVPVASCAQAGGATPVFALALISLALLRRRASRRRRR